MVFLISGYGIAHIFLGFIVGTMVGFIVGSIIVLKKITKPIFIIQISKWKNWFKDSFGFLANSLMLLLILKLSMLILIKYHPIEAVGLFGSVMAVIENSITLFVLLGITSYPVFSRLFIKSKLELIKTYKQVRNYAVIGGLLATLALLIFTVPIIKILFGQEFLGAVMGLRILSIGIIFFFLNSLNKFFLFGINKQMYNIRILSAVLLITIILGFAIIPTYGFIGAIFTSLISQAVLFLLQYLYISRNITN